MKIRNKRTGQLYEKKDGKFVKVDEAKPTEEDKVEVSDE